MEKCPNCGKELPHDSHECPECGLTLPQTDYTQISDRTVAGDRPMGSEEAALSIGSVLGRRYEILGILGKGGMGWVYKARDMEIDRVVALKVIRQDLARDETIIKRFKDEIILARKVTHKNVLRIYDIAEAEGLRFISMPFIEGRDLKAIIEERGALPVDETVEIARQVLEALKAAHDAGVIHRDLKPQNIMIDSVDGTVCVADFGIAKSADAGGLTVTGQIVGTPEYMSPEQAEGRDVDFRSDLYSFGLVLYEMLTGRVPFKAESIISTLMLRLRETPKVPSTVTPDVPVWLDKLTMKSLEKELADRYSTADEILADIESQTVKYRKKMRPRTAILIGVAVVAAAAVGLIAILRPRVVLEEKRTYVAVLPFENMTGDAQLDWLALGIPDNLTADLAQSKFFRVMSVGRLRQVAADIGRDFTELDSPEAMALLARAADLDAVATGSYFRSGEDIRITMKFQNPSDQEMIGSTIVQDTESGLLDMIDQLTRETKQIFKLSQEEIEEDFDRAVGLQRTRSVTAASQFTKGMEYAYRGSYLDAAQAFEAAIGADPDFAMAYAKASEAYMNLGYDAKAESLSLIAVDKVVKLIDRVPQSDRTFILANHGDVTYNAEWAIETLKEFIAAYPDDPEGYYKLALTYESISEWDLAAENLKQALKLDPKFGSLRFELGRLLIRLEDLDGARVELEHALAYYRGIANREGEANVLNAMGVVHRRQNDFDQAISYFEASIGIKEELGDKRGVAASLGNLGLVYKIMGKQDEALEAYERSLEIKREIGDKEGISTALNKIGQIYQNSGKFEEALSYYERSYETRKEIGAKDLMASSLSDMAGVYANMGSYDKALEMDSMALALRVEIGDERGESGVLRNLTETLITRASFDEASEKIRRALEIDNALDDSRSVASDNMILGSHCLARGNVDSAIVYLSAALDIQSSLEVKRLQAVTMALLGEAHLGREDYMQSLRYLDRAHAMATEMGEAESAVEALLSKARLYHRIGYTPGCDSIAGQMETYRAADLSFESQCRLMLAQAGLRCATDRLADARQLSEALSAKAGNEYVRCGVEGALLAAAAAGGDQDVSQVESMLQGVASDAERYAFRDLEAEALRQLAALMVARGDATGALGLGRRALDLVTRRGLSRYDCLVTYADALLATGDRAGASGHIEEALREAQVTYSVRCPAAFKPYYIEKKQISRYIDELEKMPAEAAPGERVEVYKTRFGLK